jgi:hypothetical protein
VTKADSSFAAGYEGILFAAIGIAVITVVVIMIVRVRKSKQ